MKFWYTTTETKSSFYFEPLTWEQVITLFDSQGLVTVEHFIGTNKEEQVFYKSWHGSSPTFSRIEDVVKLRDLVSIVETHDLYPYEYVLNIGSLRIERAIVEGVVFTGEPGMIQELIDKLNIPEALRKLSCNGELVCMNQNDVIQFQGAFSERGELLDFIYNDLMTRESPGYSEFMTSISSAEINQS